jgi:two-component system, chemotaxis family, sensor kinase CheA
MSRSTVAVPQRADTRRAGWLNLGKYREIVIAVAFFLLFDLGVLVLNFYTSYQIGQDAIGINLSGRQRMLSQRMTKALLSFESSVQQGQPAMADLEELRGAVKLFDASLNGFKHGATVPGGDGKPVFLNAARTPQATHVLEQATELWEPYKQHLDPVLSNKYGLEDLQTAVTYAKANNVKLLGLMNSLTTALEAGASELAGTLRMVQTGGIVLAMLNFVFILFKFIRRLRTSDAAVEAANEENREILSSVREGLFLITPDFRLGTQISQSTQTLFGRPLNPGDPFFETLMPLVSASDLEAARSYVDLLFQPHVKESLVQSINPLVEVGLTLKNRLGQNTQHYLSFQFNRAQVGDSVRHLLVTVQDVTERVHLSQRLETDRARARSEFAMLMAAVSADPTTLRQFVNRAEAGLLEVNDLLRSTASAANEAAVIKALESAARRVHAIKGDSSMLNLSLLSEQAHQFESELQRIRQIGVGSPQMGDALLSLPALLEDLLNKIGALKSMVRTQSASNTADTAEASLTTINATLTSLIQQVAQDQGKRVFSHVRLGSLLDLEPEQQDLLREITVQLARNAVAHGLEGPEQRKAAGKPAEGKIDVTLTHQTDGWVLRVRDDGAGISAAKVRERLLALKWYSEEQLATLSDRQLIQQIFRPGFSTATEVSMHAGRGVGLDVVMANIQRMGAHVRLTSVPGEYTEFQILFAG